MISSAVGPYNFSELTSNICPAIIDSYLRWEWVGPTETVSI